MTEKDFPLGFCVVPVEHLIKADWNYKLEDAEMSGKLRENIKRIGLVQYLIIRKLESGKYEVVNGNHRLDILVEGGVQEAIVFNCGEQSREDAIRLAIETNETRYATNEVALAGLIRKIKQENPVEELLKTMPYSEDEIYDFDRLLDFQWGEIERKKPEKKEKGQEEQKQTFLNCPHCSHRFEKP